MVDDLNFLDNPPPEANTKKYNSLDHYGESDAAFEYVMYELLDGNNYMRNHLPRTVPNMKALLEVKREELEGIPFCGKKTVDYILDMQEKLKSNHKLLHKLKMAISAERAQRDYKLEYLNIIKEYQTRCWWNKQAFKTLQQIWKYHSTDKKQE